MIEHMPSQQKIDLFWQTFNDGWSISYSMSLAKITGKQYRAFINSSEKLRDKIYEYKLIKKLSRKCTYPGIKISHEQSVKLGLKKEIQQFHSKKEQVERTKQIIENLNNIVIPTISELLPRGVS